VLSVLGIEPVEIRAVAEALPAHPTARTFIIVTAHGARLKARIVPSPARAARAQMLAERLSDPRINIPTGRVGAVTVESWVEGTTLSSVPLRVAHIDAAADLLRFVHRFAGHPSERLPQLRHVGPVSVQATSDLRCLLDAGIFASDLCARIERILELGLPDRAPWGLMHGDLCAANLVIGAGGRIVSIDNEHLRRGFLDYDLARTWYRWVLPPAAQRRFEVMYAKDCLWQATDRERQAWRVAAVVRGVRIRHRLGSSLQLPLDRLATALHDVER
jgi:hypothetical protein